MTKTRPYFFKNIAEIGRREADGRVLLASREHQHQRGIISITILGDSIRGLNRLIRSGRGINECAFGGKTSLITYQGYF